MRPLFRRDLEVEVLGLHLTVRRIIGLAVLACLLVIVGYSISDLGGENGDAPEIDNETMLYREESTNWPLCAVFVFLAVVLIAFLVIEVGG
jgi:hypothetical protein